MKTFEGVSIEDIIHCPDTEYSAGISAKLLYAPASFFRVVELPNEEDADYESILKIPTDGIEFNKGCGWGQIEVLIDENELRTTLDGALQRKKTKSSLDFYVRGFVSKNLGFIQKHKNTPFVFGIITPEHQFLLGNLRNRAFFESAELSSGKKYEDNAGLSVKISANTPLYHFEGSFDEIHTSAAFSRGFSIAFNS